MKSSPLIPASRSTSKPRAASASVFGGDSMRPHWRSVLFTPRKDARIMRATWPTPFKRFWPTAPAFAPHMARPTRPSHQRMRTSCPWTAHDRRLTCCSGRICPAQSLSPRWTLDSRSELRAPSADLTAGTLIGNVYRLLGPLGRGAMGVIHLARDESLDRRVAIKFIHPALLDAKLRTQFAAEARAMARVSHPNVLQIHAFGEHHNAPYFVMEFVEGQTVAQWLKNAGSPPDLDVALSILDGICQGVAAIHAADTIHYDLKPSNILLDANLCPRVADLGVAAICRRGQRSRPPIVGTPQYMAPEVVFQKELEMPLRTRADVYSLGCVAYELLTSRPPFDPAKGRILLQHVTAPAPPPSSRRRGLPKSLDDVILRALAKDPSDRTPTAQAFRRELRAARTGDREPVRILVAEDHDDFREALGIARRARVVRGRPERSRGVRQ